MPERLGTLPDAVFWYSLFSAARGIRPFGLKARALMTLLTAENKTPKIEETMPRDHSILIVDDAEDIQSVLKEVLELEGYSVTSAATGGQALELLKKNNSFSLMLLDFRLPDMSGFEFVEKLEKEIQARMPIILLSANTGLRHLSPPPGIIEFVRKPFEIEVLLEALERICNSAATVENAPFPKVS
jgi:CheY-like chemotaxis protein